MAQIHLGRSLADEGCDLVARPAGPGCGRLAARSPWMADLRPDLWFADEGCDLV